METKSQSAHLLSEGHRPWWRRLGPQVIVGIVFGVLFRRRLPNRWRKSKNIRRYLSPPHSDRGSSTCLLFCGSRDLVGW